MMVAALAIVAGLAVGILVALVLITNRYAHHIEVFADFHRQQVERLVANLSSPDALLQLQRIESSARAVSTREDIIRAAAERAVEEFADIRRFEPVGGAS